MTTPEIRPRSWWRRLLRFSIRGLLVVMVLVAIPLAWWANSAYRQRRAVAVIEGHGGWVAYLEDSKRYHPWASALFGRVWIPWPAWLVDALGVDYFWNVYAIKLREPSGDPDLEAVSEALPRLYHISLLGTHATHRGLEALGRLPELHSLAVQYATLDGEELKAIGQLNRLDGLHLMDCVLPDDHGGFLSGLTALVHLDFDQSSVADGAFQGSLKLPKLDDLSLRNTKVSDMAIPAILALGPFQTLDLGGTQVTDKAMADLARMPTLASLTLDDTQVTDLGLAQFQSVTRSMVISLRNTKTTSGGRAKLQSANSNLHLSP